MKQNILKFNFKFKNNDFFVTEKNIFAYNLVKVWPKWNNQLVYIYGPEKCGKTLISNIWIERSEAKYLSYKTFNKIIKDDLDIELIKRFNWVLDDVDKLIEDETTDLTRIQIGGVRTRTERKILLRTSRLRTEWVVLSHLQDDGSFFISISYHSLFFAQLKDS